MPTFALQLRASLEKVTQLGPMQPEEFRWDVIPKCGSCGEVGDNPLWIAATEEVCPGSESLPPPRVPRRYRTACVRLPLFLRND